MPADFSFSQSSKNCQNAKRIVQRKWLQAGHWLDRCFSTLEQPALYLLASSKSQSALSSTEACENVKVMVGGLRNWIASLSRDRLVPGMTSQSSFVRIGSETLSSRCPGRTPSCTDEMCFNVVHCHERISSALLFRTMYSMCHQTQIWRTEYVNATHTCCASLPMATASTTIRLASPSYTSRNRRDWRASAVLIVSLLHEQAYKYSSPSLEWINLVCRCFLLCSELGRSVVSYLSKISNLYDSSIVLGEAVLVDPPACAFSRCPKHLCQRWHLCGLSGRLCCFKISRNNVRRLAEPIFAHMAL